jgi:hypothetical protein
MSKCALMSKARLFMCSRMERKVRTRGMHHQCDAKFALVYLSDAEIAGFNTRL